MFVVAIMVWLNVLTLTGPVFTLWPAGQPTDTVTTTGGNAAATVATAGDKPVIGDMPAQTAPPTAANLNTWLNTFYAAEEKRKTTFPAQPPPDAQPFDLLVINICSLSWSDVEAAGLMSHPLWSHFDILFKHFNSGTSYSGPAAIRLLRASCGQPSHTRLYQPADNECYLFDNLAKLGFTQHLMMDHNGEFGGFLKEVRENGGMQSELMNQSGLPTALLSFDGSPVYDDLAVLNRWLTGKNVKPIPAPRLSLTCCRCTMATTSPASAKRRIIKSARRNCSMNWTPSLPNWRNPGVR